MYIYIYIGGVGCTSLLLQDKLNADVFSRNLVLNASCLPDDIDKLNKLFDRNHADFLSPVFDNKENLSTLLDMIYADLGNNVIQVCVYTSIHVYMYTITLKVNL